MKQFLFTLLAVCVLAFAGCAPPTPITKVYIPPAPEVQKNVKPLVVEIQTGNRALKETVTVQAETIKIQNTEIDEVITKMEELKASTVTDQVLVTDLVVRLKDVRTRNLFLETITGQLATRLNAQMLLTDEAVSKAGLKDAESVQWQQMNTTKDTMIRDLEKERNSAITARDKSNLEAANAKVYKRWILFGIAAVVLWLIMKNVLMIYFPLTKFKI